MKYETDICIAGAGPAGMTLGLLLAKMGARVLVVEHHEDFEREYRGEVLMPRFTQMFRQIGLFDFVEKYPHLKLRELEGFYKDRRVLHFSFEEIAPEAPFAIWMPQPVLLNALYHKAKTFPNFQLLFETRAENLIRENGRVAGITASRKGEKVEIRAKVTVGTDGRFSMIRRKGGFELADEHHRFDIIWFTIPKPAGHDNLVRFFLSRERNNLILPKYPDLLQCGLVVPKHEMAQFIRQGIDSLRAVLLRANPLFRSFAEGLKDFTPFNVLQAKIERVREWAKDGVLLVGDSAHTCSPVGAIGVSVAVGSAIVAADILEDCLRRNDFSAHALGRLQEIREAEVREILERQKEFSGLFLNGSKMFSWLVPFILPLFARFGFIRAFQRNFFVMRDSLPIRPELTFNAS